VTDTTTAPEPVTEVWSYMGVRRAADGKRMFAWRLPDGTMAYFGKGRRCVLGGRYEVQVSRRPDKDGDVIITRHGDPGYAGHDDPDTELVRQWRAEEAAADARMAAEARERRAQGNDALDELLDPLVELASRLRTGADRDAFLAHVIRRISHAAWDRKGSTRS
jgi:hypothetical protein